NRCHDEPLITIWRLDTLIIFVDGGIRTVRNSVSAQVSGTHPSRNDFQIAFPLLNRSRRSLSGRVFPFGGGISLPCRLSTFGRSAIKVEHTCLYSGVGIDPERRVVFPGI